MPCEEPLRVWVRRPSPGYPGKKQTVPCGTCLLCREEQARQWAVRITHEAQRHEENSFVTLSYDQKHQPKDGGLRYADLVLFWKRMRKTFGPIKYYAVGEYGDRTNRPHYHACIFGKAFLQNRIVIKNAPNMLWTSPDLQRCWGNGYVSVGALTFESAKYVASYVTKKLKTKQTYRAIDEATGELIPLEQPRPFMSRNLAQEWWKEWNQGVTALDRVVINGSPQKPPKAYDRWLGEQNEEELKKIKQQRINRMKRENPDQMRARARNAHAHAKRKSQSKSL